MAATRRNLLEAGLGAVAVTVGAGSRVQGTETKPEITVIGVDGSALTGAYLDDIEQRRQRMAVLG